MLNVLVKAINYLLSFILRGATIKFAILAVIYYIVEFLFEVLFSFLPNWFGFSGLFDGLSGELWYFLDLIAFDIGFPVFVGALGARWLIKRLPFVG